MYADHVLAHTVYILRLLCRLKLSLLKRRKVERLNCFVALKKAIVLPQQESTKQRKRRNWFVFYCNSTVIDCGWVLRDISIHRTHRGKGISSSGLPLYFYVCWMNKLQDKYSVNSWCFKCFRLPAGLSLYSTLTPISEPPSLETRLTHSSVSKLINIFIH